MLHSGTFVKGKQDSLGNCHLRVFLLQAARDLVYFFFLILKIFILLCSLDLIIFFLSNIVIMGDTIVPFYK